MSDRLVIDVAADGHVTVSAGFDGDALLGPVADPFVLDWPVGPEALEDLRWYLEDYLLVPYGVYGEKGPEVQEQLRGWGEEIFNAVFSAGPARDAYVKMRGGELVVRSNAPVALGLPWELMRDPGRPSPLALEFGSISRALSVTQLGRAHAVGGERLRVLMVISRPGGTEDVGYRMVARPLLERLDAVRGDVDLVVLRPPTLEALKRELAAARAEGRPFQVVHFDGHGILAGRAPGLLGQSTMLRAPAGEGVLVFEKPEGGPDRVSAGSLASVLRDAEVPLVVLNACQSGAVGKELEAAIATRLLQDGTSSVVGMAYTIFAVAAAEFMAAFYERLFAGDPTSAAVTAGRRRLAERPDRPSPKGQMPLADWLVPVHYLRQDVHFPALRRTRPSVPLDDTLDDLRKRSDENKNDPLSVVGTFIGRDGLFYDMEVAAAYQRVMVLRGPGGTGKTELAKAFGRWWRDTGAVDSPEWVILHSFEPGLASFGLAGMIDAIGLRVFGAQFARLQSSDRRTAVEQVLQEHRLLLIWDNFETVRSMPDLTGATPPLADDDAAELKSFVQRLAAGGRSALIITSRTPETWLGDVRRIEVGGLTTDEAIEYADWRLRAYPRAQRRRATPAFADLLRWLDGHPLSMRIVLPHLETTEPSALLLGLKGAAELPENETDGSGRTTSLTGSITYSFDHLSPDAQRLLISLCLLHGVANADALAIMSSTPETPERFRNADTQTWQAVLSEAAGVGLLTDMGANTFRIHPALPSFLSARWRHDDPEYATHHEMAMSGLLDAHAGYASWLAQQIDRGDARLAYALLTAQHQNLGQLLSFALDHQRWEPALVISNALNSYLDMRGLIEESHQWADRVRLAIEGPAGELPKLDTPEGELWLYHVGAQANRELTQGLLSNGESTYEGILKALEAQPDFASRDVFLGVTYHQLGIVAQQRGRLDDAEQWYQRSLTIEEQLGDQPGMAGSYHQLGMVAHRRGRLDEAEQWYQRSLTIKEQLGNKPGMATSYHQLGMVAQARGRLDDAEQWYQRSLTIQEQLGNKPGMATSYHHLGMVAQARGRLDDAEQWYQRSLTIEEQLGNKPGMATSYHQLGMVAQQRGRLDDAEQWYQRSLTIREQLSDHSGMASSYHQLGMVAQDRGRLDDAEQWYQRSLTIKEQLGNQPGMAMTYGQLGLLAEQRGDDATAFEQTIRCVALFDVFPHPASGPGPRHLTRLTTKLGIGELEAAWHRVTGARLPDDVREFVERPDAEDDDE